MRLLVFGKTGQVATMLERLGADPVQRIDVIRVGRPEIDIADANAVHSVVALRRPDIVVNVAAYTTVDRAEAEPELAFAVNATGAGNVADAAASFGVPVIQISTDYVFPGDLAGARREDDETGPATAYGRSKLAGETAVSQANRRHLTLRTSWVFSPVGQNFVKTMLRLAAERDRISVVADQVGNPTYAGEIANAIFLCARRALSPGFAGWGTYHFAGPLAMSWANLARLAFEQSVRHRGPSAPVSDIATADFPTAAKRPANSRLSSEKFFETFGYRHRPLTDCVEEAVREILAGTAA